MDNFVILQQMVAEEVKDLMPSEYQLLVMQDIHSEIAFPIFIRTSSKALSVWTIPT